MKNRYLLATLGVALAVGVGYYIHSKKEKKGCGCGCSGTKSSTDAMPIANLKSMDDATMANATGFSKLVNAGCTVCKGKFSNYWAQNGRCKQGDLCYR